MAWERTAFSGMAVGLLMTRLGATLHPALALVGIAQVVASAVLLVWTGQHYRDLHGRLRAGEPVTYPSVVAVVGLGTAVTTALATLVAVIALTVD